jgi:hypothetical protein
MEVKTRWLRLGKERQVQELKSSRAMLEQKKRRNERAKLVRNGTEKRQELLTKKGKKTEKEQPLDDREPLMAMLVLALFGAFFWWLRFEKLGQGLVFVALCAVMSYLMSGPKQKKPEQVREPYKRTWIDLLVVCPLACLYISMWIWAQTRDDWAEVLGGWLDCLLGWDVCHCSSVLLALGAESSFTHT